MARWSTLYEYYLNKPLYALVIMFAGLIYDASTSKWSRMCFANTLRVKPLSI